MVNHLRTLLLNERRSPGSWGEQYVDPQFSPVRLDQTAAVVRDLLLPARWTRDYRNFAATLLARLASRYPSPDPRSTLDFSQNLIPDAADSLTVSGPPALQVLGAFVPDEDLGIFVKSWDLRKSGEGRVSAGGVQLQPTFSGDVSEVMPLGLGLSFRFVGASSVPQFQATVSAYRAPRYDMEAAAGRLRSEPLVLRIFKPQSPLLADFESGRTDLALASAAQAYALYLS